MVARRGTDPDDAVVTAAPTEVSLGGRALGRYEVDTVCEVDAVWGGFLTWFTGERFSCRIAVGDVF
eukprot:629441-Amorphochlora_amoeboformis.AAC.1